MGYLRFVALFLTMFIAACGAPMMQDPTPTPFLCGNKSLSDCIEQIGEQNQELKRQIVQLATMINFDAARITALENRLGPPCTVPTGDMGPCPNPPDMGRED